MFGLALHLPSTQRCEHARPTGMRLAHQGDILVMEMGRSEEATRNALKLTSMGFNTCGAYSHSEVDNPPILNIWTAIYIDIVEGSLEV